MNISFTSFRLVRGFPFRQTLTTFTLVSTLIVGPIGLGLSLEFPLPDHIDRGFHQLRDGTNPLPGRFKSISKVQGNIISIADVLQSPQKYHHQVIRIRGTVKRLELHLDDTHHFINFVFFLKDEEQRILVFGRHDRTQGDIQLTSDRIVEVQGIFWQERFANDHRFENNLEAQHIHFHPRASHDQAKHDQPNQNG
jgi:hypothetical protein